MAKPADPLKFEITSNRFNFDILWANRHFLELHIHQFHI